MRIAADLLTVVVCVVLLAFFAREYGRPASPPSPTVQDVHIDGAVADFGRTSKTIILALRTDCVFCQRSAPFYRRLVERIERDGPDAQRTVRVTQGIGHDASGSDLREAARATSNSNQLALPGDERGQAVVGFRTDQEAADEIAGFESRLTRLEVKINAVLGGVIALIIGVVTLVLRSFLT